MSLLDLANRLKAVGGDYISVDSLIADYPHGIAISGVSTRDGKEESDIPCFTFAEDSTKFFYAKSGDLAKLYNSMLDEYEGDLDALNGALAQDYFQIKIEKVKTKSRKTYVKVTVIGVVAVDKFEPNVTPPFDDSELV